ncbi:MAG TPA: hypothetical protein VKD91_09630 [Pyrinomonadaceae bacterium]|nr:hypothetical protein [Pyrinomonadaceae bacterium]
MSARQIALPFRLKRVDEGVNTNQDLIGRSYEEDDAVITVIGKCLNDDRRVMVQRDIDGRTWSMPAWLMRLIFMEQNGKRAA